MVYSSPRHSDVNYRSDEWESDLACFSDEEYNDINLSDIDFIDDSEDEEADQNFDPSENEDEEELYGMGNDDEAEQTFGPYDDDVNENPAAGFSPAEYYNPNIWNRGEISSDTFYSMSRTKRYIQDTLGEDFTADDEYDDENEHEIDEDGIDDEINDEDNYEGSSDYWRVFVFASFYCLQLKKKSKKNQFIVRFFIKLPINACW
ncbi:MAG: hypothetical protein Ta2E_00990 [Mycoplasmoidaceae bacterium]|nr:MAG: hypothetical protein Ta2E_00990 [Mycoplasmoidaceae bacterium]